MSTTDTSDIVYSPSKKRRTSDTPNVTYSASVTTASNQTTTAATTRTTPSTISLPNETFDPSSSSSSGGGGSGFQKDSIIAQILAGADADFGNGNGSLCTPVVGVFFDDSCYHSSVGTPCSFSPHGGWPSDQARTPTCYSGNSVPPHLMMSSSLTSLAASRSLLVTMESRGCTLQHNIEEVVCSSHELLTCGASEALTLCNEQLFQLIWIYLPCPPTEDVLGVITDIRYNSKLNRKTIQLGVATTQPDIDLNLHGIDEIVLEPVTKATIRQKYFDWTSVKLNPDYELGMREHRMSPTTPESSISTGSNLELSLSSLASDTTNDSGIHGEVDVVDLKPPPPYLFPAHNATPTLTASKLDKFRSSSGSPCSQPPPSWCRAEHATKEKHRRERIKDSCDQLRVLLPYVRGRKTDMASILEMTVDYLKIVNSKLPHEFHAHVLDIMTKGGDSPPAERPPRAQVTSGRGTKRGRGTRRGSASSPARAQATVATTPTNCVQVSKTTGRTSTGRGTSSGSVCTISTRGTGGSRGRGGAKRGAHANVGVVVTSSATQGVPSIFLADSRDRGQLVGPRDDPAMTNLNVTSYVPLAVHPNSHIFTDPAPCPAQAFATPQGLGHPLPPTTDCVQRLYPTGLFTNSAPPPSPLSSIQQVRYTLNGEREGGMGVAAFGDAPTATYYHYFSSMSDMNPAYTIAGNTSGVSCGGGLSVPCSNDFMSPPPTTTLLPLSASSAFAPPPRQHLTQSGGSPMKMKTDTSPGPSPMESVDNGCFGLVESVVPKSKVTEK